MDDKVRALINIDFSKAIRTKKTEINLSFTNKKKVLSINMGYRGSRFRSLSRGLPV